MLKLNISESIFDEVDINKYVEAFVPIAQEIADDYKAQITEGITKGLNGNVPLKGNTESLGLKDKMKKMNPTQLSEFVRANPQHEQLSVDVVREKMATG
jgi:hypothetical protein